MNMIYITLISLLFLSTSCANENRSQEVDNSDTTEMQASDVDKKTYPVEEYTRENDLGRYSTAVFAGGCFWCTEAAFERIKGVVDVISGYSGGHKEYPAYGEVGAGKTGHAEAIYIYYDKAVIGYDELLEIFFVAHDPTTLNKQGPDVGEEYRSVVFYQNEEQKQKVETVIQKVNESGRYDDPVVTEVTPYQQFWVAEDYHQNYYELHPDESYVQNVSRPKVEKVKKEFPLLIKEQYKEN